MRTWAWAPRRVQRVDPAAATPAPVPVVDSAAVPAANPGRDPRPDRATEPGSRRQALGHDVPSERCAVSQGSASDPGG